MTGPGETGVVHYGLGPIGRSIAVLVARRSGLHQRVAIDVDPALHGKGLFEVLGLSSSESPMIVERLTHADLRGSTVALHSTGSALDLRSRNSDSWRRRVDSDM